MNTLRLEDKELEWDNYLLFYNGTPFTGICYELTKDGKLWDEMSYVNGIQDGPGKEWYPSTGILKVQDHYKRGYLHGLRREWFEDGTLERETKFEFGIRISEKQWSRDGNLINTYQISEEKSLSEKKSRPQFGFDDNTLDI